MQALEVSQGALNATSNNIANANTPGYTREVPQISENPRDVSGRRGDRRRRRASMVSKRTRRTAQSADSAADVCAKRCQIRNRRRSSRSRPTSPAPGTISPAHFAAFSSSLAQLSASPSSTSAQAGVIIERPEPRPGLQHRRRMVSRPRSRDEHAGHANGGPDQLAHQQIAQLNGQMSAVDRGGTGRRHGRRPAR